MKLYKVYVEDGDNTIFHWFGTQAECATKRKALNSEGHKRDEIITNEIEVPTDKKGLLEWLNANAQ